MGQMLFRDAEFTDLPIILELLADDALGQIRDPVSSQSNSVYQQAFQAIHDDPNQRLIVASVSGSVVGVFQLTFIPGLSRGGAWRGQIEAVRVASRFRTQGIGKAMIGHAIGLCRERHCKLVQLTSDKQRGEAHRFYGQLGFVASHEGFKFVL
jgi:GNAT superfamily N-acetyltransferase